MQHFLLPLRERKSDPSASASSSSPRVVPKVILVIYALPSSGRKEGTSPAPISERSRRSSSLLSSLLIRGLARVSRSREETEEFLATAHTADLQYYFHAAACHIKCGTRQQYRTKPRTFLGACAMKRAVEGRLHELAEKMAGTVCPSACILACITWPSPS